MTQPARKRVLFAEDNPDHAYLIRRLLKNQGLEPVHAATGAEAQAAIQGWEGEPPCLVLLDHELPGLSGLEILDLVRADHRFDAVPTAMFSSAPLPPRTREALLQRAPSSVVTPEAFGPFREVLDAMARHWTVARLPLEP
jgi:CheY-like chemotaxis protein